MNTQQKVCIAIGAAVIALMLLVFPATKNITIESSSKGLVFGGHRTETVIDYQSTTTRVIEVAAGTLAVTLLLGSSKKKENKEDKAPK